ncbi:MAG: lipopolysaccharide kinase InaA family protein [Gammaproteobacteria bacterium]
MSLVSCSADFAELWGCQAEAVDDPNRRGRGWSTVGKIDFLQPEKSDRAVPAYLKRQQRYRTRTLRHPLTGIATLRREYQMLNWVADRGIAVPRPLFFAEAEQQRALLVIEALEEYIALEIPPEISRSGRQRLIEAVAALVRRLHSLGIYHGCLYPKHLFWNPSAGDICLIDWEKARPSWRRDRTTLRDLDSLNRHAPGWSLRERALFLAAYLQVPRGDPQLRKWWQKLSARYRQKSAR